MRDRVLSKSGDQLPRNAGESNSPATVRESPLKRTPATLKVLLRLCHDAKAFANFNSFEHAIGLVVNIARQNEGWLKSQQQGRGPEGAGQNRRAILKEVAEPSVP